MVRDAVLALTLIAVMVAAAPGAAANHTPQPEEGTVWTVYNRIDVEVYDNYAVVDVIAEIGNRGPDPEFPFQVLVPEGAFVTGLFIERDGEVYVARIEDAEAAREEYEEEKEQEHTTALIEKQRGTQRYAFLVNVAAFETVTARLRYEVYLEADQDVYSLPLEAPVSGFGEDLGARFDIKICHTDGVENAWSEPAASATTADGCQLLSHSVGARHDHEATAFTAHYTVAATDDQGSIQAMVADGVGYFAHRFRAPADAEQLPLDLVMVLDTSGSMRGDKLAQMQDAAAQVVDRLDGADRIHIVEFNSDAFPAWSGLRVADEDRRNASQSVIEDFIAGGRTHIEAALQDGFAVFPDSACDVELVAGDCPAPRSRIIVFLTDGQATVGEEDTGTLRSMAQDWNPGDVRLFSLAFGDAPDWSLISGLAKDNGGSALSVPLGAGAEVDIRRFMTAITTPVLENVTITYDAGITAYEGHAEVLFQGSELLVVGTFDPELDAISGVVDGTASDGHRSYDFDEAVGDGFELLPRLVAYAQIADLQARIDAEGVQAEWKAELTRLALEHGFVTDYTSLVLSLEGEDEPVREFDPDDRSEYSSGASGGDAASGGGGAGGGGSGADGTDGTDGGDGADGMDGGDGADGDSALRDGESGEQDEPSTPVPAWLLIAALAVALLIRRR